MLKLLYTILIGAWRDSFGKNGWDLPIYKNRFVQHAVAFLATFLLCMIDKGFVWYGALWVALWIQIEWAMGHGCCFDLGKGGEPDLKMLKRYKRMVGYNLLCKIFPEDKWYGFWFDFVLLTIRYTYPLISIMCVFNPLFMTLGVVIASLYALYRYCPFMQKHRLLDVEIWAGIALGLYVAFL